MMWTMGEAIEFIKSLEAAVSPHYHIALAGSVLTRGESSKDLDVMVFPHRSQYHSLDEIHSLLRNFGMKLRADFEEVKKVWRKNGDVGPLDQKHVEVWSWQGKRVDVFMPYVTIEQGLLNKILAFVEGTKEGYEEQYEALSAIAEKLWSKKKFKEANDQQNMAQEHSRAAFALSRVLEIYETNKRFSEG